MTSYNLNQNFLLYILKMKKIISLLLATSQAIRIKSEPGNQLVQTGFIDETDDVYSELFDGDIAKSNLS